MISLYKENGSKPHIEYKRKKASETFTVNDLVYIDGDGVLTKLTDGAAFPIFGLIQKAVAATDDDYASTTRVPVLVAGSEAEYLMDVSTGSAAATDVGEYCDVDDHNSVDVTASTNNDIYVTEVLSATKVVGKLARKFGRVVES